MEFGFENESINTMLQESHRCLYAFLYDYERFILDYGAISVEEFLKTWTCLSNAQIAKLKVGDHVFDCEGIEYEVIDTGLEVPDDYGVMYIEVSCLTGNNSVEETFFTGDIYSSNVTNMKMYYMKRKPKGDKLCPILITNQAQAQN